ncbi:MAG: DnaA regulatory inactivator Hda [Woeseiaceae bacterium]
MTQLALPLQLEDHAVFESFWPAGNETLLAWLAAIADGSERMGCWIWGGGATGKSHLLQAVCARAGDDAIFVAAADAGGIGPEVLDGLASRRIVCLDDVDRVAGRDDWELALFDLTNQLADAGGTLLVSAAAPPREAGIVLPDLSSRLRRLPSFQLRALPEPERILALKLRARHRGLELPDDTAAWLLSRGRRDMASLYGALDRLDAEALRAQRRLTIPFARDVLGL